MCNHYESNLSKHAYVACDFKSDLAGIVKDQLNRVGVRYDDKMGVDDLVARYLEMLKRRISPKPRAVHFSEEIQDTLGSLIRKHAKRRSEDALEAWRTAFYIRHLLWTGESVTGFLTKNVNRVRSRDGLLWDFGMHHFHLSRRVDKDGFVERSSYLLFAIITGEGAYFVDIRPHPEPGSLRWSGQELRDIVHRNWPELLERHAVRGVEGDILTDREVGNLRAKNCNYVARVGGKAVSTIGGGTMADGSSAVYRGWGMELLHHVKSHQLYFDGQPAELRSGLEAMGIDVAGGVECKLVLLDAVEPTSEVVTALRDDRCLSRDLARIGFAVVEASTMAAIVVCPATIKMSGLRQSG